jgi:ankyrin repeat protein
MSDSSIYSWGSGAVDKALTPRFVASQDPSEIDEVRSKAGEILAMLLKGGADASFKDENGRTVLMRAIQDGFDLDVIKSVLDGNPQVDVVDRSGKDAYTLARDRGDAKELEMLLNATRKGVP